MSNDFEEACKSLAGKTSSGVVREFIVEVLGCLVPGVAFLVVLVPALILPADRMLRAIFPSLAPGIPGFEGDIPLSLGTVLFLLVPCVLAFLAFAYISGHLFFRQDPKRPDKKSFHRIPRHIWLDGMVRELPEGSYKPGEDPVPVEFPYHFLKPYLHDRGIEYLAALIPWPKSDNWKDVPPEDIKKEFGRRAKHFANALKIRIRMMFPDHYYVLARNEAHVRLSSSMWYVCKVLLVISVTMLVIEASALVAGKLLDMDSLVQSASLIVLPAVTGVVSYLVRVAIERVLHYQREREVLFILETAYWLMHTGKAPHIFDSLMPDDPKRASS